MLCFFYIIELDRVFFLIENEKAVQKVLNRKIKKMFNSLLNPISSSVKVLQITHTEGLVEVAKRPNLKNLSRGLNLSQGSNWFHLKSYSLFQD